MAVVGFYIFSKHSSRNFSKKLKTGIFSEIFAVIFFEFPKKAIFAAARENSPIKKERKL